MLHVFLKRLLILVLLIVGATAHALPDDTTKKQADSVEAMLSIDRPMPDEQLQRVRQYAIQLGNYYRNIRRDKGHYLQFIAGLLTKSNLPEELKIIPVIESHFEPAALSVDGACGVWQLMPETARENNLSLSPVDDRKDVYKSSYVALKIVGDLHRRFGNCLMVVAAYNCGPQRVKESLEKAGSSDYWAIHALLPQETQTHILKYLAALSIFYDRPFRTPLKPEVQATFNTPTVQNGLVTIQLTSSFREESILKYVPTDPAFFRQLNPNINTTLQRSGSYELRLPEKDMLHFLANKYQILKHSRAAAALK